MQSLQRIMRYQWPLMWRLLLRINLLDLLLVLASLVRALLCRLLLWTNSLKLLFVRASWGPPVI